ncbi:MAG: hypothetical protein JJ992_06070 [Planctomycetes bacterium]|nr:hypothetical protein [Planctomycetota bacterium]
MNSPVRILGIFLLGCCTTLAGWPAGMLCANLQESAESREAAPSESSAQDEAIAADRWVARGRQTRCGEPRTALQQDPPRRRCGWHSLFRAAAEGHRLPNGLNAPRLL